MQAVCVTVIRHMIKLLVFCSDSIYYYWV